MVTLPVTPPPSPWHRAADVDPVVADGSWLAWLDQAVLLDEPALALAIDTAAVDVPDGGWRAFTRANSLVLTGRPDEAVRVLTESDVVPPRPGQPAELPQVVLAAAHGALGDADAYAWLLRLFAGSGAEADAWFARLVASVADARSDLGVATEAWRRVVETQFPEAGVAAKIRVAADIVAERARRGPAQQVLTYVAGAVGLLVAVSVLGRGGPDPAVRAAEQLMRRGDAAGARLLLRGWRVISPRSAEVSAALRRATPTATRWSTVALVVVFAGLAVGALALAARMGSAAPTVALGVVGALWLRWAPSPGFTGSEAATNRVLRSMRYDEEQGVVTDHASNDRGWYGVVGIAGAALGLVAVGAFSGTPAGERLVTADGGLALWLGVPALTATLAVLGARSARVVFLRRQSARRRTAAAAAREREASACVCWRSPSLVGEAAVAYLEHHLEDAGPASLSTPAGDGARWASCPQARIPWLVGRLGDDGRWLALRGVLPEPATEEEESDDGHPGLYM